MSGRDDGLSGEGGFLRRWSRRKRGDGTVPADRAEENAPARPDDTGPTETGDPAPDEAAVADLPDIDSLDKESDYTAFLRDGVPEALRQRALRKLWLSDPVLANLDGLNDYDDDFGAVFRGGAAYMKRLADAGERMTRPGADEEPPEQTDGDDESEDVAEAGSVDDGAAEAPPETQKDRQKS